MKALSEILLSKHFLLYGTLDVEMARKFTEWLAASRQTDLFISVLVNCSGGQVRSARAIYDLIRQVQKEGLQVVSLVTGAALSSGVTVSLAADERYMLEGATFMFHSGKMTLELKLQSNDGLEEALRQQVLKVEDFRLDDDWITSVITKRSGRSKNEVRSKMGKYLRSGEAKRFGLVHHIL